MIDDNPIIEEDYCQFCGWELDAFGMCVRCLAEAEQEDDQE